MAEQTFKVEDFKKNEKEEERVGKTFEDPFKKVYKRIKGKTALLFGPSLVGKSTFALHLTFFFKNPIYFRIDKNITHEEIANLNDKIKVKDEHSYEGLILDLEPDRLVGHDFVIIDSLTGLNEELEQRYKPPKLYLELSRMQRIIIFKLSLLKPYTTSLIITHSRLADFETRAIEPSINNKVLKHIDIVLYMYKDKYGKRHITVWADRIIRRNPEFIVDKL